MALKTKPTKAPKQERNQSSQKTKGNSRERVEMLTPADVSAIAIGEYPSIIGRVDLTKVATDIHPHTAKEGKHAGEYQPKLIITAGEGNDDEQSVWLYTDGAITLARKAAEDPVGLLLQLQDFHANWKASEPAKADAPKRRRAAAKKK